MTVAALYDVHGNLAALEAVLADAAFARADAVVVGGDVGSGPMPAEVLDRLSALDLPLRWVRGNADREVVEFFDRGDTDPADHAGDAAGRADAFTASRIGRAQRDLMDSFEDVVSLEGALFCHGSPHSDDEIITTVTPDARLAPMLAGVQEPLVVCGHTHRQFDRRVDAHRVVNAGSVGLPYEGEARGLLAPRLRRRAAAAPHVLRRRRRPRHHADDGVSGRRRARPREPARAGRRRRGGALPRGQRERVGASTPRRG
jgi:putative phosphoesterase